MSICIVMIGTVHVCTVFLICAENLGDVGTLLMALRSHPSSEKSQLGNPQVSLSDIVLPIHSQILGDFLTFGGVKHSLFLMSNQERRCTDGVV